MVPRSSIEVKTTCSDINFFSFSFLFVINILLGVRIIQKLVTSYKLGVDVGFYHHFRVDNTSFQSLVEEFSKTVKNADANSCIPEKDVRVFSVIIYSGYKVNYSSNRWVEN